MALVNQQAIVFRDEFFGFCFRRAECGRRAQIRSPALEMCSAIVQRFINSFSHFAHDAVKSTIRWRIRFALCFFSLVFPFRRWLALHSACSTLFRVSSTRYGRQNVENADDCAVAFTFSRFHIKQLCNAMIHCILRTDIALGRLFIGRIHSQNGQGWLAAPPSERRIQWNQLFMFESKRNALGGR